MCGLFGMTGPGIIKQDLMNLENLGIVSQIRGRDGAGIYRIHSGANSQWNNDLLLKTSVDWCSLLYDVETAPRTQAQHNLFTSLYANVYIGHVRAATRGKISHENSHPFRTPSLIGAHNGTLKDSKFQSKDKTDSQLMFEAMNEEGVFPVLSGLDDASAYAVVMYEKASKSLLFARNEHRRLWFASLNSRNVMYWASERSFLEMVLDRAFEDYTIYMLRPYYLFEVDPKAISAKDHRCLKDRGLIHPHKEEERIKKQEEAKAKREAEEAAKATEGGSTPVINQSSITTNTDVSSGSIVILDTSRAGIQEPAWHIHCDCGKKALIITDSIQLRNGTRTWGDYNKDTDTFKCQEDCQTKH